MFLKTCLVVLFFIGTAQAAILGNPNAPKGGVFKFNLTQQPTTLNPLSSSDGYASTVQSFIIEGLLDRNAKNYTWEPGLADKWSISKDGLEFTFTLRNGATWHDGKPVTVEDVKFSFEAIMDPKDRYKTAHQKPYYENIKSVKIIDKKTVRFYVQKKYFANFSVVANLSILPKHIYADVSDKNRKKLNKTIIGSGPYKFKKFKRGKNITLVRNKNWWGNKVKDSKGKNNFDKILMRFVSEQTASVQRVAKGDLDYTGLSAESYVKKAVGKKWGKSAFKVKMQNKVPVGYGFIGWNLKNSLFQSVKVRKALSHLLNRKLMIEKFRFGLAFPATGPLYRQSTYADSKVKPIGYSQKDALSLLRADGWKDTDGDQILDKMIKGKKVKLSFTILEPNKDFVKYLTIYKEDAKKAGVDINIKVVEWNTFLKLLDERKFEAVRLGWGGGSIDWDPKQVWHSNSMKNQGSNFISYSNKVVDGLIDKARVTMDEEKRRVILKKVFGLIANDHPYSFFFNDKYKFYGHTGRVTKKVDTYDFDRGLGYWWITK